MRLSFANRFVFSMFSAETLDTLDTSSIIRRNFKTPDGKEASLLRSSGMRPFLNS
jgi:hypothetical protein